MSGKLHTQETLNEIAEDLESMAKSFRKVAGILTESEGISVDGHVGQVKARDVIHAFLNNADTIARRREDEAGNCFD